jgi:hypothetical protein
MRTPTLLLPLLFALPAVAQDDPSARWRIALGLGAGSLDYDEDGLPRSDSNSAGAFRLGFEGTSRRGYGGGLRLESFAATELELDNAGNEYDVGFGSLFGHFTYRLQSHRFAMPIRIGLLANALTADNTTSTVADEASFSTVGIYTEFAPEFTLARRGSTEWTLYGEVGLGGGGTTVEVDGDEREWDSSTFFTGLEFGSRVRLGVCELSLAFVGRWQSMDESDPDGSPAVTFLPYDASFTGVMFGFAVVF